MKGGEFVGRYARYPMREREAILLEMVSNGQCIEWPMRPVPTNIDGHGGTFFAASDVFSIGEPGDFLRMPLTPKTAQTIADMRGWHLITRRMSNLIWEAATLKLKPSPWGPPYD